MSYCKREGKDKSVFVTSADVQQPAVVKELVEEDSYGVILPNGEINWDCPCLGGMAYGTCGEQFKEAFSCFHYSEEEEKGVDCIPQFRAMQECFLKYPEEYGKFTEDEEKTQPDPIEEGTTSLPIDPPPESLPENSPSSTAKTADSLPPPTESPAGDSGSKTGNELELKTAGSMTVQARTS